VTEHMKSRFQPDDSLAERGTALAAIQYTCRWPMGDKDVDIIRNGRVESRSFRGVGHSKGNVGQRSNSEPICVDVQSSRPH
jgi:hypothetical protein